MPKNQNTRSHTCMRAQAHTQTQHANTHTALPNTGNQLFLRVTIFFYFIFKEKAQTNVIQTIGSPSLISEVHT